MEGPFSDKEKRFVLSEAIKTSQVPVDKLLTFINEANVEPVWSEALLPFGRNLNSCRHMLETLRQGPSPVASSLPAPHHPERKRKSAPEALEPFQTAPQPKRRQSGADNMIRIQPKPSSNGSPVAFSTPPAIQPKKRGRPSKADIEARNAAAIARGEVIPPPRTPVAKEPAGGDVSAESGVVSGGVGGMVPIAPMLGPGPASESSMSKSFQSGPQEGGTGDMVGKKRRGRPSSRSKELSQGTSTFSALGQPFGQLAMTQPPTTMPAEEPSELPALPPKPEQEGSTAPVIPSEQVLVSPSTQRSERPDV